MNPRYLLLLLVVCLLIGSVQAWGADMGAWDYRKEITVNNAGAELTNYQLKFTINRDTGVDSGFTVYVDDKCEEDYDDIRFTTGENTLCDYWIESSSSSTAAVWVEVPTIAVGDTTMYLYYGNAAASAVSNGDNTFLFFDDFPGSSLDVGKWTNIAGSGVSVSGGIATIVAGGAANYGITSKTTFGNNVTLEARLKTLHSGVESYWETLGLDNLGTGRNCAFFVTTDANFNGYRNYNGAWGTKSAIVGWSAGTYYIASLIRNSQCTWQVGRSNTVVVTSGYSTLDLPISIDTYASGSRIDVDWVLIRKYTATEPTVSAWGSEEEQYPKYLTVDFSGVPTSGYVPLTVYFTDASIGYNATLDTWAWSFGDSSANSTQQNPAHTYITSGLYDVILTVTNTSYQISNTTQKTAYINATVNLGVPNADFTVTETCGDIGDTFYFIDFSTGGGLYQWNWSFGDGAYSELRNPTHQYAGEATYSVGLTVWGAYGNDTLTRNNLITIPCGAATPTPTATPTGTGTPFPGGTSSPLITSETGTTFITWMWNPALFGNYTVYVDNAPAPGYPGGSLTLSDLEPGETHILRIVNASGVYTHETTTNSLIWDIYSSDLWFWYTLTVILIIAGIFLFAMFIPAWIMGLYCVILSLDQSEMSISLLMIFTWLVTMILMAVRYR